MPFAALRWNVTVLTLQAAEPSLPPSLGGADVVPPQAVDIKEA